MGDAVLSIIYGIISGIIASLVYAIMVNNMTVNYKYKVKVLLYELECSMSLLENGLEYSNEIIVYTSVISIQNTAKQILALNKKITFYNRYMIKIINTIAAQSLAIVCYIGQSERGLDSNQEKMARLNDIKRAFIMNYNRPFSSFIHQCLNIMNNSDINSLTEDDIHILDNVYHIEFFNYNNDLELCKSNEEVFRLLKYYCKKQ